MRFNAWGLSESCHEGPDPAGVISDAETADAAGTYKVLRRDNSGMAEECVRDSPIRVLAAITYTPHRLEVRGQRMRSPVIEAVVRNLAKTLRHAGG